MGERGRTLRSVLVIAFGAFVLVTWLLRAWYGRWIADDYCFATMAWRDGFWHGQWLMYERLNGRVSVSFLMAVITSMGRDTIPAAAIVLMGAWLAGAWRAVHSALAELQAGTSLLEEWAGALVFVAAIVSITPDPYQPLIWLLGLVTYGLPVICATWLAVLILRPQSPIQLGAVAALSFIAGGCSEVAAAAQVIFLAALGASTKRFRVPMMTGAIASAAALLVESLSQGNAIRRALFQPMSIPAAAGVALRDAPLTLATLLMQGAAPLTLLVVFFALAGHGATRVRPAMAVVSLLTMFPIVAMTLFGGFYGTGKVPWARVQFVPVAYVTIALLVAILGLRPSLRPAVSIALTAGTALLVAMAVASAAGGTVRSVHEAREFAAAADRVDTLARRQRGWEIVVSAPREYDLLEFLSPNPDHWTNRCMAEYYGLRSIRTPRLNGR